MDDGEVTPEQIEAEFHGWVAWVGVNGRWWYARRIKTSPPHVLRAESGEELRGQIRAWLAERSARGR